MITSWFCVDFSRLNQHHKRWLFLAEIIIWAVWLLIAGKVAHTLKTIMLGLSRAVMTDGENIGATRLVLEPASLAVYLARNLSPWYHDVPDIDVMGKLHAVKVSRLKNANY